MSRQTKAGDKVELSIGIGLGFDTKTGRHNGVTGYRLSGPCVKVLWIWPALGAAAVRGCLSGKRRVTAVTQSIFQLHIQSEFKTLIWNQFKI